MRAGDKDILKYLEQIKVPENHDNCDEFETIKHIVIEERDTLRSFARPGINPAVKRIKEPKVMKMYLQWR